MDADDLPGVPFLIKLTCPGCGWDFGLGLRKIGEISEDGDDERGITCCSKCLASIDFRVDGTDVRLLTPELKAKLPPAVLLAVLKGEFLAWLSQQGSRDVLH